MLRTVSAFCAFVLLINVATLRSDDSALVSSEVRELVPYRLLALVHAPEVQSELDLDPKQVQALEECFMRLDGQWFRSRNLAASELATQQSQLESEFRAWAAAQLTKVQLTRLNQLELQALGTRMFLRSDVVQQLKLADSQSRKVIELARATHTAQSKLQAAILQRKATQELEKSVNEHTDAEQRAIGSFLNATQKQKLGQLTGKAFDLTQLKRIYPMAPEFATDTTWFNSSPLSLQSLRGQVVIVHFYAFQCHNCHANFEIYRRWHKQWQDKGVVVIGIQSPETDRERDPAAVRQAAEERKLEFPIIMDAKMQNWNAWANTMWPTVYVIDKRGYLRHWWQGELNWQGATADKTIEKIVETALAEPLTAAQSSEKRQDRAE